MDRAVKIKNWQQLLRTVVARKAKSNQIKSEIDSLEFESYVSLLHWITALAGLTQRPVPTGPLIENAPDSPRCACVEGLSTSPQAPKAKGSGHPESQAAQGSRHARPRPFPQISSMVLGAYALLSDTSCPELPSLSCSVHTRHAVAPSSSEMIFSGNQKPLRAHYPDEP